MILEKLNLRHLSIKNYIKHWLKGSFFSTMKDKLNISNEDDITPLIEEKVVDENLEVSDIEIETYESIEVLELSLVLISESQNVNNSDDLNENEKEDPRVEAMFKRSRHCNISFFTVSQDCYELPKRTYWVNGKVYHNFKTTFFRDAQNLYQHKTGVDTKLNDLKLIAST